jgi:hypothetical protein
MTCNSESGRGTNNGYAAHNAVNIIMSRNWCGQPVLDRVKLLELIAAA